MTTQWSPPGFTLRQLQYALAVDETRGFRKAAEACSVSQPSLSAQLGQLEQALGTRLFERAHSGALRTRAGDELLDLAREVLVAVAQLERAAGRVADPRSGPLRIGVIPTIAPYLLPSIAGPLRDTYPKLRLLWHENKTDALVEDLLAGRLDTAVVALEADLGAVESIPVTTDAFVVAMAPGHALASRNRDLRDLRSLGKHPVYLLDEGHCFRDQALSLCARVGVREADFRATSLATLVQVVASQGGLTLLPELALEVENRNGTLTIARLRSAPTRTLGLIWRRGSQLEALLGEMASTIAAVMSPASNDRRRTLRRAKGTRRS